LVLKDRERELIEPELNELLIAVLEDLKGSLMVRHRNRDSISLHLLLEVRTDLFETLDEPSKTFRLRLE
jgi:hypothetical protein